MVVSVYGLSRTRTLQNKKSARVCIVKPNSLYPIGVVRSITIGKIKIGESLCGVKLEIEYSAYNKACHCFSTYIQFEDQKGGEIVNVDVIDLWVEFVTKEQVCIRVIYGVTIKERRNSISKERKEC